MYKVSTTQHFDAAHFLRGYPGPCQRLHGHRFLVEVIVSGEELNKLGMLIDFKTIKDVLKTHILSKFDHYCLNEIVPFDKVNPTAENLAKYIYDQLKPYIEFLDSVKVYESPDCYAEYRR